MNLKKIALAFTFGLVALLSGCASVNRQAVQVFPPAQTDKGVVYFYRESKFVGCAISYNVKEGDKVLGPAGNGTYFFVIAEPGSHTYTASTESTASRTINVEAGKIYYVECGVDMGIFAGRPSMKIVTEDEGKSVLPGLTYATK
jgi:hypothetical protein